MTTPRVPSAEEPYYCVICGECRIEIEEDTRIVIHNDKPHPPDFTYDEEDNPQ